MERQPKLVRDRIPERIRANGDACEWRYAAPEELGRLLGGKVIEEAEEFIEVLRDFERAEAELGDLFEAVEAALALYGLTTSDARTAAPRPKKVLNEGQEKLPAYLVSAAAVAAHACARGVSVASSLGEVLNLAERAARAYGFSLARAVAAQRKKRETHGGFARGIVLTAW